MTKSLYFIFGVFYFISNSVSAQYGNGKTINNRNTNDYVPNHAQSKNCSCLPNNKTLVCLIEGLPLKENLLTLISPSEIETIQIDKETNADTVLLEVFTKSNSHSGLRYIKEQTNYYIKTHPNATIVLNDQRDSNITTQKLLLLRKEDIKEIRLNEAEQTIYVKAKRNKLSLRSKKSGVRSKNKFRSLIAGL